MKLAPSFNIYDSQGNYPIKPIIVISAVVAVALFVLFKPCRSGHSIFGRIFRKMTSNELSASSVKKNEEQILQSIANSQLQQNGGAVNPLSIGDAENSKINPILDFILEKSAEKQVGTILFDIWKKVISASVDDLQAAVDRIGNDEALAASFPGRALKEIVDCTIEEDTLWNCLDRILAPYAKVDSIFIEKRRIKMRNELESKFAECEKYIKKWEAKNNKILVDKSATEAKYPHVRIALLNRDMLHHLDAERAFYASLSYDCCGETLIHFRINGYRDRINSNLSAGMSPKVKITRSEDLEYLQFVHTVDGKPAIEFVFSHPVEYRFAIFDIIRFDYAKVKDLLPSLLAGVVNLPEEEDLQILIDLVDFWLEHTLGENLNTIAGEGLKDVAMVYFQGYWEEVSNRVSSMPECEKNLERLQKLSEEINNRIATKLTSSYRIPEAPQSQLRRVLSIQPTAIPV